MSQSMYSQFAQRASVFDFSDPFQNALMAVLVATAIERGEFAALCNDLEANRTHFFLLFHWQLRQAFRVRAN